MASTRIRSLMTSALAALVLLVGAPHSSADHHEREAAANPLEPFGRLVGSEWHSGDNYHALEWGLGKLSVVVKSYFMVDGKPKLVSEGMWYWHPVEKTIKGVATSVDMGVTLWDYTTSFEGNTMRSDLVTYAPDGKVDQYVETWEFTDENTYVWSLLTESDEGLKKILGSTYTRK